MAPEYAVISWAFGLKEVVESKNPIKPLSTTTKGLTITCRQKKEPFFYKYYKMTN